MKLPVIEGLKEGLTNKKLLPWTIGGGALLALNNHLNYKPREGLDGMSLAELNAAKNYHTRNQKVQQDPTVWNRLREGTAQHKLHLTQTLKEHPMFTAGLSALVGASVTGSLGKRILRSGLIKGVKSSPRGVVTDGEPI